MDLFNVVVTITILGHSSLNVLIFYLYLFFGLLFNLLFLFDFLYFFSCDLCIALKTFFSSLAFDYFRRWFTAYIMSFMLIMYISILVSKIQTVFTVPEIQFLIILMLKNIYQTQNRPNSKSWLGYHTLIKSSIWHQNWQKKHNLVSTANV